MTLRRRLVVAAAVVGMLVLPTSAALATDATGGGEPVQLGVTASPPFGPEGTKITVQGQGWPESVLLQVALCGNLFLNGISDCDTPHAVTTTSTTTGTFFVDMIVGIPPVPCPCVLHVSSPESTKAVDQPFEVFGAETETPSTEVVRRTVVLQGTVDGSGPWTAWIGGAAERTFTLTVQNTGTVPLLNPLVVITAGQGNNPTGVVAQPQLGEIPAGGTVTTTVPVSLGPPTFGRYTVKATVSGIDQPTTVSDTTSSYPFILIGVAWLLIQIPLLGLYRRRRQGPEDPLESDFDALLLAPADYGVESVRGMVGGYPTLHAADEDPLSTVVVGGSAGQGSSGRQSLLRR